MQAFTLNTPNGDAWRRLLLSGKTTPALSDCSAITLAGGIELLATAISLRPSSGLFQEMSDAAGANDPFWHLVMSAWTGTEYGDPEGGLHGIRRLEFFRLRTSEEKTSLEFELFLERFCRSIKQQGFPTVFANALSKVLDEMADNVIQHSGILPDGFSGIAGYHVENKRAAFTVADIGRGILATLKESPVWHDLSTAREGLRAIVMRGASSRVDQGGGEGFRQLFGSLIDRNSVIRLRTDDSALLIAEGRNEREGGEIASPFLPGLQLSISCSLRTGAAETEIKF